MLLKTVTLGCKVNQYETEYVRQGLVDSGHYSDAEDDQCADVCIVNTCTVTAEGDSKSRQVIRRLARQNPDARLVVMGCYATRDPEQLAQLPGVVEVVTDKRELPDLLGRFGVVDVPDGISRFGDRHRAYLKVQDGCLLKCSYCIIPQVRPKMYSRDADSIVAEAQRLIGQGYRELVLTGIHLGHYGVDHNYGKSKQQWNRLSTLVRRLVDLPDAFRVRLSSIEATEVTRELLSVMSDYPDKVCPHLHVCLQSGSDAVLRRMRRRWGRQRFVDRCGLVLEKLRKPALTTDVIVGFPGETDAEFEETCEVVQQVGFSKIHIFPFSARRGTPAASMEGTVSKAVKSQRSKHLATIEHESRAAYFQSLVGEPLEVLVESEAGCNGHVSDPSNAAASSPVAARTVRGTSCRYGTVQVKSNDARLGDLVKTTVTGVDAEGAMMLGETNVADR